MSEYIAVADARSSILDHIRPTCRQESIPLDQAVGRILAEPIDAQRDAPPFRRSAMDGYAFRAKDTPGTLNVVGTIVAGNIWSKPLNPGDAVRIMTGAFVPPECDTVLEQEAVQDGHTIAIVTTINPARNIMQQGHEYLKGTRIFEAGTPISPIALGQMAGLGLATVPVLMKPRVLVLVTGNEVVRTGAVLPAGHIYDGTGPLLKALIAELGAKATVRYGRDDKRSLYQALARAGHTYDLVLTTGGVSVGIRDYLPEVLSQHFQRLFWRVDMHPGKAMAAGLIRPGVPVLSLSGNPGATLTAWYLIVAPAVAKLLGQPYQLKSTMGRLIHDYPKATRETRYLKARFIKHADGYGFDVSINQSSDAIRSFQEADGLVVIPHQSPPQPKDAVVQGLFLPGRSLGQ